MPQTLLEVPDPGRVLLALCPRTFPQNVPAGEYEPSVDGRLDDQVLDQSGHVGGVKLRGEAGEPRGEVAGAEDHHEEVEDRERALPAAGEVHGEGYESKGG